ncbi:MAG: hypothetical protein ACREID_06650 [Planctomycetota bacterium]
MSRMFAFPRAAVLVALGLALACGGGGGQTELTITAQNASTVAAQAVAADAFCEQMSGMVEGFAEVFANPGSQVFPCDTGNAATFVDDVAPQGELSAGDSASVTFNACTIDLGGALLTLNGSLSFTVTAASGAAPDPFSYALSVDFGSLTMVAAGVTAVIDGGFVLEASSDDGTTITTAVSGDFLSAFASNADASFSGTLTGFRWERTVDTTTGDYALSVQATISGSEIGGTVTYVTTVPFLGTAPNHPHDGVLVVTGANGSTLTLIALDDVNVQFVVDTDGDGTPEATIDTTWDALDGA